MRVIYLLILAMCLPASYVHAEYGQVKHDGYKVKLGAAMGQIVPEEWSVNFTDNSLRNYQVHWSRGARWTEVLDEMGNRFDVAFILDSPRHKVFISNTEDLRARGLTVVATDYEASRIKLNKLDVASLRAQEEMMQVASNIGQAKSTLIETQQLIRLKSDEYVRTQDQLVASQAQAVALGMDIDNTFGADLVVKEQVAPVRVISTDPRVKIQMVEAGDLVEQLNAYFKARWNFGVVKSRDGLELQASLPYSLRMPGTSIEDDVRTFSKAVNNDLNKLSVFFRVMEGKNRNKGVDGVIEIKYAKKAGVRHESN